MNQTRGLPPVRVDEVFQNPVRDLAGAVVPPWLTELTAPTNAAADLPSIVDAARSTAIFPSEDGASWTFNAVGAHGVRWHQYPCEDTMNCYVGGVLQQTAYDHGISEDVTVTEGSDAAFTGWIEFPGAEPTGLWQVSTDGGATWQDIPGSTLEQLKLTGTAVGQSGTKYRQVWTVPGVDGLIIGDAATLTVKAGTTTPPGGGGEGTGVPGKPGNSGHGSQSGQLAQSGAAEAQVALWGVAGALVLGAVMALSGLSRRRR